MCAWLNHGFINVFQKPYTLEQKVYITSGAFNPQYPLSEYNLKETRSFTNQSQTVTTDRAADEVNWTGYFGKYMAELGNDYLAPVTVNTGLGNDVANFGSNVRHAKNGAINLQEDNDRLNLTIDGIDNDVRFDGGKGTDTINFTNLALGKGSFTKNPDNSYTYVEPDTEGTENRYTFSNFENVEAFGHNYTFANFVQLINANHTTPYQSVKKH